LRVAGLELAEEDHPLPEHLRLVEETFREATRRGLCHLTAEDELIDGRFVTVAGQRHVNFGSCSYVGLETDARLKLAACDAVNRFGVQFASSRAYVSSPPYREFEHLLELLFGAPVVVAQTTSLAHFAALPVLVGRDDAVVCDQRVHHSVQAVLPTLEAAGVSCSMIRHNRVDRLEERVVALSRQHRKVFYLGDGVYSMHGDTAPVAALRDLLARHERLHLYLDDAHGMSWTGLHGRGHVLGAGAISPRMVVAVSLAKAFAASGGALIFPDRETARVVRSCGSTMIFSGPLQPALLGAGIASARIHLSAEIDQRQQQLRERIRLFNLLAREHGLPLGSACETPIRFVRVGSEGAAYQAAADLMAAGFYTNIAVFPAVSRGQAGLRIALTVHQTLDDIRRLIEALAHRSARSDTDGDQRLGEGSGAGERRRLGEAR
jgi:7-keto-8-aminopelargonate synthetase-like enzyme